MIRSLNNDECTRVDIVPISLGAYVLPSEYKGRPDDYINSLIREPLLIIRWDLLARFRSVFREEGVFSVGQSRRSLAVARDYRLLPKLHADKIVSLGGAELATRLGAVSADHLLYASGVGAEAMVRKGVVTTLPPPTVFALKGPCARGRGMIDAGCVVVLATDLSPRSCFSGSIPLAFALAYIHMWFTVEKAITTLTPGGAAALNRADSIGSIEVGKRGDFVMLGSDDYNILPYYVGMNCVSMTVRGGVLYPSVWDINLIVPEELC